MYASIRCATPACRQLLATILPVSMAQLPQATMDHSMLSKVTACLFAAEPTPILCGTVGQQIPSLAAGGKGGDCNTMPGYECKNATYPGYSCKPGCMCQYVVSILTVQSKGRPPSQDVAVCPDAGSRC